MAQINRLKVMAEALKKTSFFLTNVTMSRQKSLYFCTDKLLLIYELMKLKLLVFVMPIQYRQQIKDFRNKILSTK